MILNHLIFLPPPPSYDEHSFPGRLCWIPSKPQNHEPERFMVALFENIALQKSRDLILYFHGNSSDIGENERFTKKLSQMTETSVLAVEYPGYGIYKSRLQKPSEMAMFDCVTAVFDAVSRLETVQRIFIVGYSLGTTCACHIGRLRHNHSKLAAVILLAPFASIHNLIMDITSQSSEYVQDGLKRLIPNTHFPNVDNLRQIHVPTLIVHGTKDTVIPVTHAHILHRAGHQVQLHIVQNMTHNIHDPIYENTVMTFVTEFLRPFKTSKISPRALDLDDKTQLEADLGTRVLGHLNKSLANRQLILPTTWFNLDPVQRFLNDLRYSPDPYLDPFEQQLLKGLHLTGVLVILFIIYLLLRRIRRKLCQHFICDISKNNNTNNNNN